MGDIQLHRITGLPDLPISCVFLRFQFVQELLKQQLLIQLLVLIGKCDELADPGGIKWDVLRRGKTAGEKEFLKIGQYGIFH